MTESESYFNAPDADVFLKTSTGDTLGAHRIVLKYASPFFCDLFAIPQPHSESSNSTDHPTGSKTPTIDVPENAHTLSLLLRLIYPIPSRPHFTTVDALAPVLVAAHKYEMQVVIDELCQQLVAPQLLSHATALRIFALAERLHLHDVRRAAMSFARCIDSLAKKTPPAELADLPAATLFPLLIAQREWRRKLDDALVAARTGKARPRCDQCDRTGNQAAVVRFELCARRLFKAEVVDVEDLCSAAFLKDAKHGECTYCHSYMTRPGSYLDQLLSSIRAIPNTEI